MGYYIAEMETRDLECFVTLAELLHFGKTAHQMNTSPSALSRIIQRLEEEIGVELFVRDNRSTILTEAGQAFLPRARSILSQWTLARSEFSRLEANARGELRIFATVTACYSLLPPFLQPFRNSFPRIDVRVLTGDSAGGIEMVLAEQTDLAIVPIPPVPVPRVKFYFLGTTPLVFVGPTGEPEVSDWTKTPVILPEAGVIRTMIDDWFRKKFIRPRIYAQVRGNEAVLALVHLGFGLGFVPELVVQNSPLAQGLSFLPPLEGMEALPLGIAYLATKESSPLLRAFLQNPVP